MLVVINEKKIINSSYIFISFTTFHAQNGFNFKVNSKVKEIIIENNFIINESEIKKDLSFLYNEKSFLIKNSDINENLSQSSFIESFEIKRIYLVN